MLKHTSKFSELQRGENERTGCICADRRAVQLPGFAWLDGRIAYQSPVDEGAEYECILYTVVCYDNRELLVCKITIKSEVFGADEGIRTFPTSLAMWQEAVLSSWLMECSRRMLSPTFMRAPAKSWRMASI